MIHTAKGFSIVNEIEVDIFLLLAFSMIQQIVGSLTSCSSAFSQPSLYVWKFLVHIMLKPSMQDLSMTLLAWRSPLVAQMVKSLSTMRETKVWALGGEDPLEKEMAVHSSTIAWKIPWTEEPGRLQSMGSQRIRRD